MTRLEQLLEAVEGRDPGPGPVRTALLLVIAHLLCMKAGTTRNVVDDLAGREVSSEDMAVAVSTDFGLVAVLASRPQVVGVGMRMVPLVGCFIDWKVALRR